MTRPGLPDYLLLIILALMWGSSFTFIKIGVDAYSPLLVAGGRLMTGALVLWIVGVMRGLELPKGAGAWRAAFGVAMLGNAVPFFLISFGETRINAGLAAILMSLVPLTTLILAHFLTEDEKLSRGKIIGVILGTIGVIVLVGPESLSGLGGDLPYQGAVLIAAICYGISSLLTRALRNQPRIGTAAVILTFAALITMPCALIIDRPWQMGWRVDGFFSILYLGTFSTGIAMFLILALVARAGASFLALNNYLVPAVGVMIGFAVLGEVPAANSLLALLIITAGIAAANLRLSRRGRIVQR